MTTLFNLFKSNSSLTNPGEVTIGLRDQILYGNNKRSLNTSVRYIFNQLAKIARPPKDIIVTYLSDNGGQKPDAARSEIKNQLIQLSKKVARLTGYQAPDMVYDDTPAQDPYAGGFRFAQISRYAQNGAAAEGVGQVVFLNCAPRKEERGDNKNTKNGGEPIYIGMLPNGTIISANNADNFHQFRDLIEQGDLELYETTIQKDGTQFRSRDVFPLASVLIASELSKHPSEWKRNMSVEERREFLSHLNFVQTDKVLSVDKIAEVKSTVLDVDVHGNLKTSERKAAFHPDIQFVLDWKETPENKEPPKLPVKIKLTSEQHKHEYEFVDAYVTKGMFQRGTGEAGINEGSSGSNWDGAKDQSGFIEISVIGQSAEDQAKINEFLLRDGVKFEIIHDNENNETDFTPVVKSQMEQTLH